MNKIIIAIDGFSGTGKSSTAKAVAKGLDYIYIDSGAMYRACTLYFLNEGIDLQNEAEINAALGGVEISFMKDIVLLNGQDVSDEIRTMKVNNNVSAVSSNAKVREKMVDQQRKIGMDKGIVMDGRDIGTVVFPKADLKIFMTANPTVRAKRRQAELKTKGIEEDLLTIEKNLIVRDAMDSSREHSPLVKSDGAIEIDTSNLNFDEQVEQILSLAKPMIYEG
ncbi:MAG: (d)CMP kinase [Cyclobacteriaceae bacterium]